MFLPCIATVEDRVSARALELALAHTETSRKVAADAIGIHESQLSRWLAGQGHITTAAALRLPDAARIEYFELLGQEAGAYIVPHAAVDRLLQFFGLRPPMLKATLESGKERRYA